MVLSSGGELRDLKSLSFCLRFAHCLRRSTSLPLTDGHLSCMQEEKLNEAGVQELPPGFHLCQLPFADDIRTLGIGKTLTGVQREPSRC